MLSASAHHGNVVEISVELRITFGFVGPVPPPTGSVGNNSLGFNTGNFSCPVRFAWYAFIDTIPF
jgi:hypothetical protein